MVGTCGEKKKIETTPGWRNYAGPYYLLLSLLERISCSHHDHRLVQRCKVSQTAPCAAEMELPARSSDRVVHESGLAKWG